MRTNTSMTLYHKRYDSSTTFNQWDRYNIDNVMWQDIEKVNVNKGYTRANEVNVYIPYDSNPGLELIPISNGDIIIKGKIDMNITKQNDLPNPHFNIITIINYDYGISNRQHIQIGAQ